MKKVLRMRFIHQLPKNRDLLWSLCTHVGALSYERGFLKTAHLLFFRANKVAQQPPRRILSLAASRYNLSLIYRYQRRFRKAMTALKQSLLLVKSEHDTDWPRIVMLLDALGDTCVESGLLAKATTFYERANAIESKLENCREVDLKSRLAKLEHLYGRLRQPCRSPIA